jgi:hypothetical protein
LPRLWTRVRRLLWSWWLWAALAVLALLADRSYTALGLAVAAVVIYMAAPRERAPTYGLDHDFAIESEEFLSTVAGATGAPFLAGNSLEVYNNGDEFYPAMLSAVERDLADCDQVLFDAWLRRGACAKTVERLASLLKEQI